MASTPLGREDGSPIGVAEFLEPFLDHLRSAGYAERTLRKKRTIVTAFARWTRGRRVRVDELNETHLATFTRRLGRRKAHAAAELTALRLLLGYLRSESRVPMPAVQVDDSFGSGLARAYEAYLRKECGLTEYSVLAYLPHIRDFLADRVANGASAVPSTFDAQSIRDYLLNRAIHRSSEYSRLLATSLRSFLRFLFHHDDTVLDLSMSIPTVRTWSRPSVPAILSPEEVERILAAARDRATPCGSRDYAILLLLARLGLRAGEVVALELDDIRWRAGEIIVRSKGRVRDRLPLLADIGEALASYLQTCRGTSVSRRVFLRMYAPHVGLTGPAAVGHIARRALARVAIRPSGRAAAHIFRHSLATRMVRHGASLPEISQVLRHHSEATTAIYAQVSFEALRGVALPWPTGGGAK